MNAVKKLCLIALACVGTGLFPSVANAWWNADFKQRTKITLNTSAQGVETKEALSGVVVPIRLHSGNFDFLGAKPDGSDIRVVGADDKTPLKFAVERFDGINEMAVIWVQLPTVAPGTDHNTVYVYAGSEKAAAEAVTQPFEAATLAVFHFSEKDGLAADHTGAWKATQPTGVEANGQIAASAKLEGQAIELPVSDRIQFPPSGPISLAVWAKPLQAGGSLYKQGPLSIGIDGGKLAVRWGSLQLSGGDLPAATWAHIAFVAAAGKATLFVNGSQAAQADLPPGLPQVTGPVSVGKGFIGLVDELQIDSAARSADWVRFTHAAQAADARLVASVTQTADSAEAESGGEAGYMSILVSNLTVDAIIVIAILGFMFVIAAYVMVTKSILVGRADKANRAFLESFREAKDVMSLPSRGGHEASSLARLYEAGLRELTKRDVGRSNNALSGASLDAVKASVDADMVRENHVLNSKMVLLTIAISGGPFLGLLGTVVGVMITFAAIAAAGDVNVNAIAPGIAAALLATVAGLGVAIPALFGYNYLASRIKNISSDMQIFVDEFVTRVAESYGAR